MPTVNIIFKDLRAAIVALNEAKVGDKPLLEKPIKLVGVTKEDILKTFMDTMNAIPDNAEGKFPGPKSALDFYNSILESEEKAKNDTDALANGPAPKNTPPKQKAPSKEKEAKQKAPKNTEKKDFIESLIAGGKNTKKEIVQLTVDKFPDTAPTSVVTMISDGKNPKYNKFSKLVVIGDDNIVKFA